MSVFKLPQGIEISIAIYLMGKATVDGYALDVPCCITLRGFTAFFDGMNEHLDVPALVKSQGLDAHGQDWRVMTPAEIADYKKDNNDER